MKLGYNLVVSTYWGDYDGHGENVMTYEKEEDAKFWAYVISAFYRRPNKNMKVDFKKFLEDVSSPVELPDEHSNLKKNIP